MHHLPVNLLLNVIKSVDSTELSVDGDSVTGFELLLVNALLGFVVSIRVPTVLVAVIRLSNELVVAIILASVVRGDVSIFVLLCIEMVATVILALAVTGLVAAITVIALVVTVISVLVLVEIVEDVTLVVTELVAVILLASLVNALVMSVLV